MMPTAIDILLFVRYEDIHQEKDPFHSKIKNDPNECDKEAIKRIKAQIKYVNDTKTRYLN